MPLGATTGAAIGGALGLGFGAGLGAVPGAAIGGAIGSMYDASKGNLTDEQAGLLPMVPLVGKQTFGYYQYLKGLKEKEALERPEYQIPAELQQNLTQAQLLALEGLPAEQKKQFVENVMRSTTGRLQGLSSRKAGLAGVGAAGQSELDAYKQLLGADATARQQNIQTLMGQREKMAGAKDTMWQINEMQPYLQKYAEAQGLIGAGSQNMMTGTEDLTKIGIDTAGQVAKFAMMV